MIVLGSVTYSVVEIVLHGNLSVVSWLVRGSTSACVPFCPDLLFYAHYF